LALFCISAEARIDFDPMKSVAHASKNRKVKKVVIPVAGMGTRFLPVTKVLPKELLPIVSTPIIQFIVEECVSAGFETIVFVTSRPKILIEDYFDPFDLTSYKLNDLNKSDQIEQVVELAKKIDIVSVRQYQPRGLGHAVLQAEPIVRDQNFAVVLGDDLILNGEGASAIGQCVGSFEKLDSGTVIGALEVPKEEVSLYGVMDFKNPHDEQAGLRAIRGFVEKPSPGETESNWAMPGRYVFEPEIISALRETPPSKNQEIQLTDAMQRMLQSKDFFGCLLQGERHDTGDKFGYIKANVAVALRDPALKGKLREWLVEILSK